MLYQNYQFFCGTVLHRRKEEMSGYLEYSCGGFQFRGSLCEPSTPVSGTRRSRKGNDADVGHTEYEGKCSR